MRIAGANGTRAEAEPLAVRRLTYADLPAVLAIERGAFPAPWSLSMFVLELSKPSSVCLAAAEGERMAGYLVCTRFHDIWHLMNVAVAPDRRRCGIASALVERLFAETRAPSAHYTLEVRASNRQAITMYEGLGFRRSGLRSRYYRDNGEDALVMWLDEPAPVEA